MLNNYTYNTNGNPTQYVIQNGAGTEKLQSNTEYTANGAFVSKVTDQHGYATTYDYNQNTGVLNSITDINGNTLRYEYNQNNDNLLAVSQTLTNGKIIKNTYDYNKGNINSITHNGFRYGFEYDAFGNVTKTSVGNQILSEDSYIIRNGNLKQTTFGNGDLISYTYDDYGNIIALEQNRSSSFTWKYNNSGYMNEHHDNINQRQYNYGYDTTGRLIRQNIRDLSKSATSDREMFQSEYQYDENNNISKFTNNIYGKRITEKFEFGGDNLPSKYTMPNGLVKTYKYGPINRPYQASINTDMPIQFETLYHTSKRNTPGQSDFRTMQVYQESLGNLRYYYSYDKLGNITEIKEWENGSEKVLSTYEYDELNYLTRENDLYSHLTKVYTYDDGGNILQETQYNLSFGELGTPLKTIIYEYGDENWKDKLTTYDGKQITYDVIGNPLSYRDYQLTWSNGTELAGISGSNISCVYKYDSDGIRSEKTVNGIKTVYYYVGDQLAYEKRGENVELFYFYDGDANLTGIRYINNNASNDYLVTANYRGDINAIYTTSGTEIARYTYDAWGNVTSVETPSGERITDQTHISNVNPFRYRSYYLDSETGLYYLKSRYYDPETHRMLNADEDGLCAANPDGLTDKNYFAYCDNNPVMRADEEGDIWHIVAGAAIGAVVGAATSAISQYVADGKVDMKQVAISSLTGAIGGGCAATGIPLVGQMAIGAVLGGGGNIAEQLCNGKSFKTLDVGDALVSATVGAAAGAAGGKGADHYQQNMMRAGKQVTKRVLKSTRKGGLKEAKRAISTYKKNTKLTYKATGKGLKNSAKVASGYSISSSIKKGWNKVTTWANNTWNTFKGWFK